MGCEDAEEDSLPPLFRSLATEERKLSDLVFGWLYRAAPGGGGPGALSRAEEEEETGRKSAGEERDSEEVAVVKEKEPRTFGAWGVNREALFLFLQPRFSFLTPFFQLHFTYEWCPFSPLPP